MYCALLMFQIDKKSPVMSEYKLYLTLPKDTTISAPFWPFWHSIGGESLWAALTTIKRLYDRHLLNSYDVTLRNQATIRLTL